MTDQSIQVGRDYEDKHNPEGVFVAWLSWNFNAEARGHTTQEAVDKLRSKYPNNQNVRVVDLYGNAK